MDAASRRLLFFDTRLDAPCAAAEGEAEAFEQQLVAFLQEQAQLDFETVSPICAVSVKCGTDHAVDFHLYFEEAGGAVARAEVFNALSTALTNLGQPYFDFSFSDNMQSRQLRNQQRQRRLAVYDFELYMEGYTPPLTTTSTLPDAALSNGDSPSTDQENDMALIIGIIVAVLVILIVVIVLVVVCRRKKPKRSKVGPINDEDAAGATKHSLPEQQRKKRGPVATHASSDVSYLKDNARVALPTLQSSADWTGPTDVATAEESLSRQQSRRRIGAARGRGRRRGRRAADLLDDDDDDETLPSQESLDTKRGQPSKREKKRAPRVARQASKVIEDTKVQGAVLFVDEDSEGEEEGGGGSDSKKPRERARSRRVMPWEGASDGADGSSTAVAESHSSTAKAAAAKDAKVMQTTTSKPNREMSRLLHSDSLKSVGGDVLFADEDSEAEDAAPKSPVAASPSAATIGVPEMKKLLHSTTLRKVSGSTMFNDEDSDEDDDDDEPGQDAKGLTEAHARVQVDRTATVRADSPAAPHQTAPRVRTVKSSGHAMVKAQQNRGKLSDIVDAPKARDPFGASSAVDGQATSSEEERADVGEGKHRRFDTVEETQACGGVPSAEDQVVSLVERGTRQVKQAPAAITAIDSAAENQEAHPATRQRRERPAQPSHKISEDPAEDGDGPAEFAPAADDFITPSGKQHSRRVLQTDPQLSKIGMENFLPSRDQHSEASSEDDKEAVVQVVVHKKKSVDPHSTSQRKLRQTKKAGTPPPATHQAEPDTVHVAPSAQGEALASKVNRKKRIIRRRKQVKDDSDEDELDVEHTVDTSSRFRRHRSSRADGNADAEDEDGADDGRPSTVSKERLGDKMVASAW